jgi:hypothetical protein
LFPEKEKQIFGDVPMNLKLRLFAAERIEKFLCNGSNVHAVKAFINLLERKVNNWKK